ncbi:MAG TPA: flagellar biosynthesis protein FlhA [Planctomycetota bacterium]|nr:flagellar biosynthesis protein FlhA [Planctomycetota bacterium]
MSPATSPAQPGASDSLARGADIIVAAGILGTLSVILMPIPPWLLDALLVLNITASFIVLLSTAYVTRPLELRSFPSLLLVMTFFRLALNVATTRLILGTAQEHGTSAAGGVVRAFADFVAGTNLVVGLVIFAIFVVVQFVVITRGATRISEVAARFTLDAMPGKQLAIDNDMAAGSVGEEEAQRRRAGLNDEAAFHGAMDGASKFVRGEAIAGLVITIANIAGGFLIGVLGHGMEPARAAEVFTRLTVGDGLVTQVPALMVALGAALLVTKSAGNERLGVELARQLLMSDRVLFIAAAFALLLIPSGLPVAPLLLASIGCTALGFAARARNADAELVKQAPPAGRSGEPEPGEKARSLLLLEPLELELGYRLIDLVDEGRGGDLLARLGRARERVALDLGLVVPPVKIEDNTRLHPAAYSIKLRGISMGQWRVRPGHCLVLTEGEPLEGIDGAAGVDPVSGKAGLWVDGSRTSAAAGSGYRVRSVIEVISDHLDKVMRMYAAEILTREEVSRLVNDLRGRAPALVEELIPGTMKLGDLYKVLQGLLAEQVSIRDLETILETLADAHSRTRDIVQLTEEVRLALARSVCGSLAGRDGILHAFLLDPALEEFLQASLKDSGPGARLVMEPEVAEDLLDSVASAVARFPDSRQLPVLVCSGRIRAHLRKLIAARYPFVAVLSYEEVTDDVRLEECGAVALEKAA